MDSLGGFTKVGYRPILHLHDSLYAQAVFCWDGVGTVVWWLEMATIFWVPER